MPPFLNWGCWLMCLRICIHPFAVMPGSNQPWIVIVVIVLIFIALKTLKTWLAGRLPYEGWAQLETGLFNQDTGKRNYTPFIQYFVCIWLQGCKIWFWIVQFLWKVTNYCKWKNTHIVFYRKHFLSVICSFVVLSALQIAMSCASNLAIIFCLITNEWEIKLPGRKCKC